MTDRNWECLLLSTLQRARDFMPGPGITDDVAGMAALSTMEQKKAKLGIDIDDILEMAHKRGENR